MKKIRQLVFFAFLPAFCLITQVHGQANQNVEHIIDFSAGHNLKAVFDAGLRPWLFPGDIDRCNLGKLDLKFVLPSNQSFSVNAERVEIDVLADNEINSIDISCAPTTLTNGVTQVKNIGQLLDMDTKGLDEFLNDFSSGTRKEFGWGVHKDIKELRVNISYTIIPDYQNAASEVLITLEWLLPPGEKMKFLTSPIKPPPGYENVSMDPPPPDPNHLPHQDPYNVVPDEEFRRRINGLPDVPIQPSIAATSNLTTTGTNPASNPIPSSAAMVQSHSPTASWFSPWYGLLAILAVIVAIYAIKRK